MKNKFKPSDLGNFEENDFENLTFDKQKELVSKTLSNQSKSAAFRSIERMQKQWSSLLMAYLVIFTIAMFATLWFNGKCVLGYEKFCISDLSPITLNFLITAGFVKVIGVVWIIVRHLFPHPRYLFPTKKQILKSNKFLL